MQKRIRNILKEFEQCMRNVFKEDFCKILVYGSYARGDYNENSDVDVMILVNTPLEKINSYYDQVSDCAFDFMMKYGIDISPVIKNVEHFNKCSKNSPTSSGGEMNCTSEHICSENFYSTKETLVPHPLM